VAVQGCGNVGFALMQHLLEEGAEVYATDMFRKQGRGGRKRPGPSQVEMDKIYDLEVDIFCSLRLRVLF